LTFDEKRRLCLLVNKLEGKNLAKVVQIIYDGMGNNFMRGSGNQDTEEVEINIESLNTPTLRELEEYLHKAN